jgi:hypothetical protein
MRCQDRAIVAISTTSAVTIASAGTGECNFVFKAVLLAKQRKNLFVKRSGLIHQHIGLQMNPKHYGQTYVNPPKAISR